MVLGLPRGGVPVAAAVASELALPLDVLLVRKIGTPGHPELAMGALAEDGTRIMNDDVARAVGATDEQIARACARAREELDERAGRWRGSGTGLPVDGRAAIVVDDGVATGATLRAALQAVRARGASPVIAAAPVAAPDSWAEISREADRAECVLLPEAFMAVGRWYDQFDQTPDEEVARLLVDGADRLDRGG